MDSINAANTLGLQFTETMHGYFSTREKEDYTKAEAQGGEESKPFSFTVTIAIDDLERFISDKLHLAKITGVVTAPDLSQQSLAVTSGDFNLFIDDADEVNTKKMRYSMHFAAADGKPYYLFGFKTIRDDPGLDIWPDTTTLRIKVYSGDNSNGTLLGAGILHIGIADFLHQLTTMRVSNAKNSLEELQGIARFGRLFAGALYEIYGGVFSKPNIFNPDAPPRQKRRLDVPSAPEVYHVDAGDGVMIRLTRYRGGNKGPVMCVPGLGVSSLIFSTDLIERNLVEELVANKYDVWLLDYRSSIELPYAAERFTADDVATKDYPAAVSFIRKMAGVASVQCLVHCYGATTFFMAMLAGLQGVRSAAVSQIATHMQVPVTTKVKAVFHAADFLDKLGVQKMTAHVDTHESFLGKVADELLKFYPVHDGPRDTSPVSRRISFLYGQLYEINQLNEQTYDNLHELFGVAGIASLEHLGLMIRKGHLVNFQGEDIYLQEAQGMPTLDRLAIPIAIAHGALNKCWEPVSTQITIDILKKANDPNLYDRRLIPGYGHIDCVFGKNASRDVFPYWIQHLDKTAQL
jgi:cholesterol oxidase